MFFDQLSVENEMIQLNSLLGVVLDL